ncbi:Hsp70 family protein [Streptomyces sp. NPDC056987]|uniref:Hsp70 family protein n=1 Tax=Streptomyces sp. NPDC056987 TaxID=3345988 RepID=UPI003627EFA5
MTEVNLGLDFGATGLRAAYSVSGRPTGFMALTGADRPWLLCVPATAGPVPVAFPSLKSMLGENTRLDVAGQPLRPVEIVARALAQLCRRVLDTTSGTIGQVVISVPARFGTTQRAALLEAAETAGLTRVSLISDSVAAVIGHTGGEGSGTYLSYGMGYDGFELGLVRVVRGRYRVLGYEGARTPGGRFLDSHVLGSWLHALRPQGLTPGEVQHGEAGWLRLRAVAEQIKETLSAGDRALFPVLMAGPDNQQPVTMEIERQSFATLVRLVVAPTLDRADHLFDQSGMRREDVDTVVLSGGSTRLPELRGLISGLGTAVVPSGNEHIARGAALHANRLSGRSPGYEEQLGADTRDTAEPQMQPPPLNITLLTAPGTTTPATASHRPAGLDAARRLIEEGRLDQAGKELRQLIAEAQALLDDISAATASSPGDDTPAAAPPPRDGTPVTTPPAADGEPAAPPGQGPSGVAHLLARARRLIAQEQYQQAIGMAHLAWQREPDRPDVFEEMIDLHCTAATAAQAVETFTRDEEWLRCALGHDPNNARIRALLAERSYTQGRELSRLGRRAEAMKVLEQTLKWDPDHRPARDLLHTLGRSRGS